MGKSQAETKSVSSLQVQNGFAFGNRAEEMTGEPLSPPEILDCVRRVNPDTELSPDTLRHYLLVLTGWLYSLGQAEADARRGFSSASLDSEEAMGKVFSEARLTGDMGGPMSVSAAEKYAKMSTPYMTARRKEIYAEHEYRKLSATVMAVTEGINTLKKVLDTWVQEGKLVHFQR